ncbi:hypothetical protein B0H21DRAFT_886583 [Amylocystis lapponica]|nr:hypothetical protein B0H21DRAFT_886583 [Amylocystis lapponica]
MFSDIRPLKWRDNAHPHRCRMSGTVIPQWLLALPHAPSSTASNRWTDLVTHSHHRVSAEMLASLQLYLLRDPISLEQPGFHDHCKQEYLRWLSGPQVADRDTQQRQSVGGSPLNIQNSGFPPVARKRPPSRKTAISRDTDSDSRLHEQVTDGMFSESTTTASNVGSLLACTLDGVLCDPKAHEPQVLFGGAAALVISHAEAVANMKLRGLEQIHSSGVFHRDINPRQRRYLLRRPKQARIHLFGFWLCDAG